MRYIISTSKNGGFKYFNSTDTGAPGNSASGVDDEPKEGGSYVEAPMNAQSRCSASPVSSPDSTVRSDDSLSNEDFNGFECTTSAHTSVDLEFSLGYKFSLQVIPCAMS